MEHMGFHKLHHKQINILKIVENLIKLHLSLQKKINN